MPRCGQPATSLLTDQRRPSFRHRLEYAAVTTVVAVVRVLPMRAVLAAGTLLGLAFHAVDGGHRRLAVRNLESAFPVRTVAERRAIARHMFEHFGRLLMVLLKFSTMSPAQMLARVEFEGEDRVRAAHAHARGVLLFTGHFGFWEINALVHGLTLRPMAVLARPLDNPLLHDLLESVRRSTGNSVIYRRGAIRRVLRALEANPERTWMGYSVGRWEGDTLVVDSFGFNDRTWLDARGLPHTEALRTTERYRRRAVGLLQVELTVTDPGAFANSWTLVYDLRFQPDTEMIESVCEDKTRWIGRASDAERGAVAVPPDILAKYVGVYSGLWGERVRTVRVQLEGGTLYSSGLFGERVRLIPHSATTFMGTDGYSFDFDPNGNPAAFMVERHVSGDWRYARQPDK